MNLFEIDLENTLFNLWNSSKNSTAGGCNFYIKNELKSKYLMTEVYKQDCFSVITENSNWAILTKNLITLKR